MSLGLIGIKCGMTRVFDETGQSTPVTVVEVPPNTIAQLKAYDCDGYYAAQVVAGNKKASRLNKASIGHYKKAGIEAGAQIHEFSVNGADQLAELKVGSTLPITQFTVGQLVDVRGLTRGKGYAGTVKRHNFRTQDATHGNSLSHRAPGSIGQCQTPGRVMKGKKMAGHMGNVQRCSQNLQVVRVDEERNLLLIKGALPGAPGGTLIITQAIKSRGSK